MEELDIQSPCRIGSDVHLPKLNNLKKIKFSFDGLQLPSNSSIEEVKIRTDNSDALVELAKLEGLRRVSLLAHRDETVEINLRDLGSHFKMVEHLKFKRANLDAEELKSFIKGLTKLQTLELPECEITKFTNQCEEGVASFMVKNFPRVNSIQITEFDMKECKSIDRYRVVHLLTA